MKKIFLGILIAILITGMAGICYAAPEDENVEVAQYGEPVIELEDESVPAGGTLPKTGGIPAEAFYVAGAMLVASALVVAKVSSKSPAKGK